MPSKLPGISFQSVPPIPAEILPRMDIAAFVGFASSGPLHIPVPVDDIGMFRDIFGADLPLARDELTCKMKYALLPQAVESFFKNGGRRCWIVRVAGEGAKYNRFSLPGLAAVYGDTIFQAEVRARAQGSWSDDLMAGAVLGSKNIEIDRYTYQDATYTLETPSHVEKGDLLRLDTGNVSIILAVDSVKKKSSYPGNPVYSLEGSRGFWFTGCPSILSYKNAVVFYLTAEGEIRLPHSSITAPFENISYFKIKLKIHQCEVPHPGSLLRIKINENMSIFLTVSGIESTNETIEVRGKYPHCMTKTEPKPLKSLKNGEFHGSASILNLELFAMHDEDRIAHIKNLSFVPGHPRFFGNLPTDEEFFSKKTSSSLDEEVSLPRFPFAAPEQTPERLPKMYLPLGMPSFFDPEITRGKNEALCLFSWDEIPGKDNERLIDFLKQNLNIDWIKTVKIEKIDNGKTLRVYNEENHLFLRLNDEKTRASIETDDDVKYSCIVKKENDKLNIYEGVNEETELDRDGLSAFDSSIFIDDALKDTGSESLLNEANFLYYQEKPGKSAPLKGIHSLLPVEEVTLVAVPDAVHAGWEKKESILNVQPLSPPVMKKPVLSDDKETYNIYWNRVNNADSYIIQESTDVSFKNIRRQDRHNEWTTLEKIDLISIIDCPHKVFFRIRAECKGKISGWSNTVHIQKPLSDFRDCIGIIESPELRIPVLENGWLIRWGAEHTNVVFDYTLQESVDPEFLTAVTIYRGKETSFLLRKKDTQIYYFRVKAENITGSSPWSNTVNTEISRPASWVMLNPDPANLLKIQRSLLRFCLARGDMFAVLTLPVHYLEADALSHKLALENCPGEENITSFGALYHPWLHSGTKREKSTDSVGLLPPDGAVCGKIAYISESGAAWLSPANVAVYGAVSLMPVIDNSGWERLYSAGINLIRHEPRGFLIMSASTLSKDPMFSNINVRRLIILLRRLSLREGAFYTFQPNNEDFWRLISHRFEMLLGDMYTRGAFAGSTPEESYRVVADSSINTIQSIEQGRFIIELQVAPSLPMTFITVRLVQTGNYGFIITEV